MEQRPKKLKKAMKFTEVEVEVKQGVRVAHAISVGIYLMAAISVVSIIGGMILSIAFQPPQIQAVAPNSTNTVTLTWTAPGDDLNIGTAAGYRIRHSSDSLNEASWPTAAIAANPPTPLLAGTQQSMNVTGLTPGTLYYFAVKSYDEADNESAISNIATKRTDLVACTPEWSCTTWSDCRDGEQARTCVDIASPPCGSNFNRPIETQTCTTPEPAPTSCVERWSCTDWTDCVDGARKRVCQDLERCGTDQDKPAVTYDCSTGGALPDDPLPTYVAVAQATGGSPEVRVYRTNGGKKIGDFFAYRKSYRGGLSISGGDVNGDGDTDVVVGTGRGTSPQVSLFTPTGKLQHRFFPYPSGLRTGVNVAVADVDGDGQNDLITAPAGSYPALVRVFRFDTLKKKFNRFLEFTAFDAKWRGGVNLAAEDLDRNGLAEVMVTPSSRGRGSQVQVFEYDLPKGVMAKRHAFYAYGRSFKSGVEITAADVNGDGQREIVTSPAPGAAEIRVFTYIDRRVKLLIRFFAGSKSFRGGADLASSDLNKDGQDEILTVTFSNGQPGLRVFTRNFTTGKIERAASPFAPLVFSPRFQKGVRITSL
ncbi:MAG: FG-GAP repeat protein [Candidatus Kerfeldbacteria bacterium]|nr:FG-GAP repeat protein [Candidatus Kerfeldbacteria bacterium]